MNWKTRLVVLLIYPIAMISAIVAAVFIPITALVGSERSWNMLVALDRLGNAATGGQSDQTISDRANTAWHQGKAWGCVLCKILNWIQRNHCQDSAGT